MSCCELYMIYIIHVYIIMYNNEDLVKTPVHCVEPQLQNIYYIIYYTPPIV